MKQILRIATVYPHKLSHVNILNKGGRKVTDIFADLNLRQTGWTQRPHPAFQVYQLKHDVQRRGEQAQVRV
jgi:hypothetical protein